MLFLDFSTETEGNNFVGGNREHGQRDMERGCRVQPWWKSQKGQKRTAFEETEEKEAWQTCIDDHWMMNSACARARVKRNVLKEPPVFCCRMCHLKSWKHLETLVCLLTIHLSFILVLDIDIGHNLDSSCLSFVLVKLQSCTQTQSILFGLQFTQWTFIQNRNWSGPHAEVGINQPEKCPSNNKKCRWQNKMFAEHVLNKQSQWQNVTSQQTLEVVS